MTFPELNRGRLINTSCVLQRAVWMDVGRFMAG